MLAPEVNIESERGVLAGSECKSGCLRVCACMYAYVHACIRACVHVRTRVHAGADADDSYHSLDTCQ